MLTLTAAFAGRFTRFTRASMVEVLRMDYIRTARAKGAGKLRVVFKHALRNARPVVTVLALSFGALLGGALITETMFAQRGMGKLIFEAIMGNDFNLALMGLLLPPRPRWSLTSSPISSTLGSIPGFSLS